MRKLLAFLLPILIAIIIFIVIAVVLNKSKNKGALQVTSNPGAKVYLNNKLIGQTPLCKCEAKDMLEPGEYNIKLVSQNGNYASFDQKITIVPKVLTVVDRIFGSESQAEASLISLNLIADKKSAQVSVISYPQKAQVYIDSNLVGNTPLLLKNITQSDHEIKLSKDGYKDKIIRIRAVLGYKLDAIVYLGIDPQIASSSAMIVATDSASLSVSKVLILNTPTGFLRVRDEPSVNGKEVIQLKPGSVYSLLEEGSDWFKIKIDDQTEGWVSSAYAQKQ